MYNNLEHPLITKALETGYSENSGNQFCDDCGDILKIAYLFHDRQLCDMCAEKAIREELNDMNVEELAELFKVDFYEFV